MLGTLQMTPAMSTTLIPVGHARESVLAMVRPLGSELVAIDDARGRVLAEDVQAAGDVPPFPSSAMDGYAIRAGAAGRRLTPHRRVAGGHAGSE